jgi:hypothetical protein
VHADSVNQMPSPAPVTCYQSYASDIAMVTEVSGYKHLSLLDRATLIQEKLNKKRGPDQQVLVLRKAPASHIPNYDTPAIKAGEKWLR